MARAAGRSYYTYKQVLVRAIIELEQEHSGHSFHTKTLQSKIRDLAQSGDVHLGENWNRYIKRAVTTLLDEGVLRSAKPRGHIALSPKGKKRVAASNERYGSLEKLSPFKKSQFLKDVTVTSPPATSTTQKPDSLAQKCNSLQRLMQSLRVSLDNAESTNKSICAELEETKRERDDLELSLRDLERSTPSPSVISRPELTLRFDPVVSSIDRPEPTIPSDRNSSPAPTLSNLPKRPIATFSHRPSGSFLNTISNQFTPSPSPGPVLPTSPPITPLNLNPLNNDDDSDDDDAGGDVDFDMTDAGYTDMAGVDGGYGRSTAMDMEVQTDADTTAIALADALQQLAVARQDLDTLDAQLRSRTAERDVLQRGKLELETALRDREAQLAVAQANNASVLAALSTAENRISALTTELAASNSQRDDATARLSSTASQLQTTNVQLQGVQDNLHTVQRELDTWQAQHQVTQAQLVATQAGLKDAIAKATNRERDLKTQLEDAQEAATLVGEDLERIKAAWVKAEERKRLAASQAQRLFAEAAEADQEVHSMLFSKAPKREASFRDSGISIDM